MDLYDIKLGIRYCILVFFMYLAWLVITPTWINSVKDIDPTIINVMVVSVFGALTLVLRKHLETKIHQKENKKDEELS